MTTVAIVATVATLAAQKPAAPPAPEPAGTTQVVPATPATTLRMQGTITAYDHEASLLSLSTTSGVVRFAVPDTARVRLGGKKIERQVLVTLGGYTAAVHYSAIGGHTTLRSVDVFDKSERKRP